MPKDEPLKTIYAEVPEELHKQVRIRAIEEGRSTAALIREALRRYLGNGKKSKGSAA